MNALIFNGTVIQIEATPFPVHPSLTWEPIPAGQTVEVGYTFANGTFTAPPAPPTPTLAQQAAAALGAGLTVTSTGTPAINGTYAIADGVAFGRADIGTEAQFISTFSEFTNGTQTLEWPLLNGTFVTFPSTASFMNFAKAAAQYYAAVKAVVAAGQGSFPSNQVTIP